MKRAARLALGAVVLVGTSGVVGGCERDALDRRGSRRHAARRAARRRAGDDAPVRRRRHAGACARPRHVRQSRLPPAATASTTTRDGQRRHGRPGLPRAPARTSEDTFADSIRDKNHGACIEDCYFDQDSGIGNDGCVWSHACDPLSVAPDYPPAGATLRVRPRREAPARTATCARRERRSPTNARSTCGPLTPNGCDCFGCCAIPGAATPVWLGSVDELGNPSCDAAHVADPTRCKPCTQVESCLNAARRASCASASEVPPRELPGDGPAAWLRNVHPMQLHVDSECLPACTSGRSCITGAAPSRRADAQKRTTCAGFPAHVVRRGTQREVGSWRPLRRSVSFRRAREAADGRSDRGTEQDAHFSGEQLVAEGQRVVRLIVDVTLDPDLGLRRRQGGLPNRAVFLPASSRGGFFVMLS